MKPKVDGTKVVFGPVRFSYAHVFTPYSMDGDSKNAKYQTGILIDKSDKVTLDAINQAIDQAKEDAKLSKWKGSIPKKLELPLRDGDDKDPADDDYANKMYLNAKCTTRPGVVHISDRNTPLNEDEFKSGDWGYVSISFYGYDTNGNKGIAVGLNNIMKSCDGVPMGGRISAEADFADVPVDEDDDL